MSYKRARPSKKTDSPVKATWYHIPAKSRAADSSEPSSATTVGAVGAPLRLDLSRLPAVNDDFDPSKSA